MDQQSFNLQKNLTNIPESSQLPWWKRTVVYQIYPRSYMDSNEDGIGDLKGIISKLDYIKDLGVETIWFSPFYSSPQEDFGYDISDYQNIAPEYGNMQICDELIDAIHARGLKIVLDMVLNHTSNKHPWFLESKSSRDNPKRDWYTWKDGKKPNGKKAPTNWLSMTGGSAWHYDKETDQWYYAQFLPIQPDLNYRNPEVKKAMFDIVRFWLKKKIDGFRLDMINAIYEDPTFRNAPFRFQLIPNDEHTNWFFRSGECVVNHPDNFQFVKELRAVIEEFHNPDRILIGETSGGAAQLKNYVGEKEDGLNLTFLFKSIGSPLTAPKLRSLIEEYETHFAFPLQPTWVFSNHDRMRRITRFDGNLEKAKLNMAFQLTMRGVPFVYYGEEIGQVDHNIPVKRTQDVVAMKYKKIPQFIFNFGKKKMHETINRDDLRTPMQWDDSKNAGFCIPNIKPWLPVTDSYSDRNVRSEMSKYDSIYNCYRRFLKIRTEISALNSGLIELLKIESLPKSIQKSFLGYKRFVKTSGKLQTVYVYLNFAKESIEVPLLDVDTSKTESLHLIVSTKSQRTGASEEEKKNGLIKLDPFEAIVFQYT
jgi:glycosidase